MGKRRGEEIRVIIKNDKGMTKKMMIVCGGVWVAVVAFLLFLNVVLMRHYFKGRREGWTDTTRVTVVDTVVCRYPVAVDSLVVRYVRVRVPVVRDTLHSICTDTIQVDMPITQKRYEDSTYTAWVSGYEPSLDSIRVYARKEVVTINKVTKEPLNRFVVSFNVGYGLTPQNGLQPYIGVGVGYKLFSFGK